jgi:hypothetical protein
VSLAESVEWYRHNLNNVWWEEFEPQLEAFDLWLGMIAGVLKENSKPRELA